MPRRKKVLIIGGSASGSGRQRLENVKVMDDGIMAWPYPREK